MISTLDKKLLRDLRSSLGTLLAIVAIVAIGISCIVAMGSSYRNLQSAKQRYYAQCRMADFTIDVKKMPAGRLRDIEQLPGVGDVRGRIRFYSVVDLPQSPRPLGGLVISLSDRRRPEINDIVMRQGDYFSPGRDNQVIVGDAFARTHGIKPGDWIHLLLSGRRQELLVVGTAISSEFVYMLGPGAITPDPEHFGVFYIKRTYAEDVFDFGGAVNQVVGQLAEGVAEDSVDPMLDEAETMLDSYGVLAATPLRDQPSNKYLSQEIEGLAAFAFMMPTIFLIVAALVLNILMSRLVEQQRTTIGTLKAIGYGSAAVFSHYLKFALAVGLVGGILGVGLGYQMASAMTAQYKNFFEFPDLRGFWYTDLALTAVVVALAAAAIGAAGAVRAVLRLQPAEAMRPKAPDRGGAVLIERIAILWRRLDSRWRSAVRNLFRHRIRSISALIATSLGAAILVNGLMMAEATFYLIDFQFKWIQRSDVELSLFDHHGEQALDEARRLPGVDRAEPTLAIPGTMRAERVEKKTSIIGILPDARLTIPRDVDARAIPIPESGIVMSRTLADILHVRPGDTIEFTPSIGRRRTVDIPIALTTESFLGTAVYADISYLNRLIGEEKTIGGIQLQTDRNPENEAKLFAQLKQMPSIQAVGVRADMIRNLEKSFLDLIWVFLGVLIVFSGMVFFGAILNVSLVSLSQRRRELATLSVLGYGPWQVGGMLLRESLPLSILGTLIGMPLGYLFSWGVSVMYNTEMFRFPVVSSPSVWIATFVVGTLFALFAHAIIQRIIIKTDWLEALQTHE